jgi:hypothetical protein
VETHNSQEQQLQQQWQPHKQPAASQSINPPASWPRNSFRCSQAANQSNPRPPSASLLYTVVNEVSKSSWGGPWHCNERNLLSLCNVNILGKAAVLHFAFTPSVAGAVPNSACRLFDTAVFMSRSYRLLIIHSPQPRITYINGECHEQTLSEVWWTCLCHSTTSELMNNNKFISYFNFLDLVHQILLISLVMCQESHFPAKSSLKIICYWQR